MTASINLRVNDFSAEVCYLRLTSRFKRSLYRSDFLTGNTYLDIYVYLNIIIITRQMLITRRRVW